MKNFYLLIITVLSLSSALTAQVLDVNFTGNCGRSSMLQEMTPGNQSFVATRSGTLNKVAVGISWGACTERTSAKIVAEILKACGSSVLATQTLNISTTANVDLSLLEFVFSNPVQVTAGESYILKLSVPRLQICRLSDTGFEPMSIRWHFDSPQNCGASYPDGNAYMRNCTVANFDYYFQTFLSNTLNVASNNKPTLALYPNPAQDFIQIPIKNETSSFEIYTIFGSKIKSGKTSPEGKIDIRNLEKGIYLLKIAENKIKFIKE